jgi:hypothetical protein
VQTRESQLHNGPSRLLCHTSAAGHPAVFGAAPLGASVSGSLNTNSLYQFLNQHMRAIIYCDYVGRLAGDLVAIYHCGVATGFTLVDGGRWYLPIAAGSERLCSIHATIARRRNNNIPVLLHSRFKQLVCL